MNITPLRDIIVLKQQSHDKVTSSGLILSGKPLTKTIKAEVLAVGPGKTLPDGKVIPMNTKPGDFVLINSDAGDLVELDKIEYRFMIESDIAAIL